jgi:TolB protein
VLATLVAASLASTPAQAAFPGTNGRIAFIGAFNTYPFITFDLYTIEADGSGLASVPVGATLSPNAAPAWSPDGSRIALADGGGEIKIVNADGGGVTTVNAAAVSNGGRVDWSPDGRLLVFAGVPSGDSQSELFTIGVDGTRLTQITHTIDRNESSPSWSPLGSPIVFSSRPVGGNVASSNIYSVKPDGTLLTPLTDAGGDEADWSPNGAKIVFSSLRTGEQLFYMMNADGTNESYFLMGFFPTTAYRGQPAWSADGQKLVFSCSELCTVNADGSGWQSITSDPHFDVSNPSWQPLNALDRYPRPGGASPYRVPLVPVFRVCGGSQQPNSAHISPLAFPSCAPPLLDSDQLTLGTVGGGQGSARLVVIPGDRTTAADEADVQVNASMSDVRMRPSGSDYAGSLILTTALRITDRANGFGNVAATVADAEFSVPFPCATTPSSGGFGSDCSLVTTADTLVPGVIKEGKRTIWSIRQLRVRDAGADGDVGSPPNCPPTCGTGDERTFLDQGLYTP